MTLKDFVLTCNTNTLDLGVLDKQDNLLFEGMLYLVLHLDDSIEVRHNKAYFSFDEKEEILNSNIEAWDLDEDGSISVRTDYDRGYKSYKN